MNGYYTVFHNGEKIACFFRGADMIEFIERSALAGCGLNGWKVLLPDGKPLKLVFDIKARVYV